jgi:hypothetical protein
VLHVCCMCVACALHGQALNWGRRKNVGSSRVLGGRGETLEAERLGSAMSYMAMVAHSIHLCLCGQ